MMQYTPPSPEEMAELVKPPPMQDEPEATPEAPEAPPADGIPEVRTEEPEAQQEAQRGGQRYQTQLQALMEKARAARDQQVQKRDEKEDFIRKLELAKQIGPDAVLKVAGVEREKIDIDKLLGKKSDEQDEIKARIDQLDNYIKQMEERQRQEEEQKRVQDYQSWEQNEIQNIGSFIKQAEEKYQYVGAASEIGSDKDIYNGLVSMYNQGYQPSYDEIADLVESRIEQLIDLVSGTKKFSEYMGKKFGVQLAQKNSETVTLTEGMKGESAETVDLSKMTDEENRAYALKQARLVREAEIRKLREALK